MGQNGGARPGAGRPRKRDKYAGQVVAAEDRIADQLPQLIDNLFRLADGIYREDQDEHGTLYVYSTPPDRQANEYLMNRVLGKPTERQEHTGANGDDLRVLVVPVADRA